MDPRQTGVTFTNALAEVDGARNRTLYNGSGVATGDIDADGRVDVLFARLQGGVVCYRNLGGWKFTSVTEAAGLTVLTQPCRGVVLADVTGDGALDLLVATQQRGVQCWRGDGRGHFTDMTAVAGTASSHGSMTLALADVDGNGTLDLYVANNRADDIRDQGQVQLRRVGGQVVIPPHLSNRLVMINGQPHEYGEADQLFLNDGTGRFREASWTQGLFVDEAGKPLVRAPLDWGLTATFRDLNADGAPDLYVCNDFWTPDRLWINDGQGRFRASSWDSLRHISGSSMGVDMADLDADGLPEIFVVDMLSRWPSWRKRQLSAQPASIDPPGQVRNCPQVLRNTLFQARGDGTYAEVADYAGVAAAEWAWQPLFMDVDLDGLQDVLITTGHKHDVQDRDAEALVQSNQRSFRNIADPTERQRAFSAALLENMRRYPPLETPIVALRQRSPLRFDDLTSVWGTDDPGVHHGIAAADFDGDGDLDFAVNRMNAAAALYQNHASAPRIALRLRGLPPNTQGVGAKVILRQGAVPMQFQEVVAGGRYLSGGDSLLVFAAGTNATALSLEVHWRNGATQQFADLRPNQIYTLTQNPLPALRRPDPSPAAPSGARPALFLDTSAQLAHRHHEVFYDDFLRQPLLPWRLSQLGPGVVCGDLNRDGWDDLVVGTGAGGTVAAWLNERGQQFQRQTNPPFSQGQARDTLGMVLQPQPDGSSIVLAASASYEDGLTNAACLLAFALGDVAPRPVLRDLPSSVGTLALGDIDADGDLDLLVGTRVHPGRWPEARGTMILRREGTQWVRDEINAEVLTAVGAISSAVWTDLNLDGYPDLVIVGEWSAPRLFRNDRGRLRPWSWAVRSLHSDGSSMRQSLSDYAGLWQSVTTGDFDGDGRMDLLLGNWGENCPMRATFEQPLTLLAGSWRGDASLGLIETEFDPARRALTPTRSLPELSVALPFLAGQFSSQRAYADATLAEVLRDQTNDVRWFRAATLASIVFLNRGDETWQRQPLPDVIQYAPVFGMSVADFDGDGTEDVFLAQNFFAVRPGAARLDAGRGLVLLGDGRGQFQPLSSERSGVKIEGEQRGTAVADFDRDGRTDLVVAQNGAETRLFRNAGAVPGLRVRLRGRPGNPAGIGCLLRLGDGQRFGPVREIHGGSALGSFDTTVPVLSWPSHADEGASRELRVQWPGGRVTTHAVGRAETEIEVAEGVE